MNANCENKSIDMISNPVEKLKQQLIAAGQEHIFDSLPQLNEKSNIFLQLTQECSNWKELLDNYAAAKRTNPIDLSTVTPLEPHNVMDWTQTSQENKKVVWNIGLEAISNSEVAAVIMSGGQGTRLGFDGPKGMYDIGLPSKKSIFQIHIEKIIGVRQLAQNRQQKADNVLPSIPIYIMTSSQNDHIIREYFRVNDYFNYPKDDVVFFAQALQPCLTTDGKIIIESEDTLSMAPDGNGGLYQALQVSGCLTNILERRIKHLHIYGVDNMLTKSVDPAFIGLCIQSHSECGNKVVWRANKSEKVGVTVEQNKKMCIIEYSDMNADMSDALDAHGVLLYGAGNICNHYISVDFLCNKILKDILSIYHLASKKIPYMDPVTKETITPTFVNGIKMEMFIFDVFPLADKYVVMNVLREEEFAPVKNANFTSNGTPSVDSPHTAKDLISNLHRKWLQDAGAIIDATTNNSNICEISPLVSYDGNNLENYNGKVVVLPCYIDNYK